MGAVAEGARREGDRLLVEARKKVRLLRGDEWHHLAQVLEGQKMADDAGRTRRRRRRATSRGRRRAGEPRAPPTRTCGTSSAAARSRLTHRPCARLGR